MVEQIIMICIGIFRSNPQPHPTNCFQTYQLPYMEILVPEVESYLKVYSLILAWSFYVTNEKIST